MTAVSTVTLVAEPDFVPHVGETTHRLGRFLVSSKDLPDEDAFTSLHRERALAIIRKCGDPRQTQRSRTSLAIGYVQSGKTISMTTLACIARDNGYRIIVVLAGTTKNLVNQSRERFANYLRQTAGGSSWTILDSLTAVRSDMDGPTLAGLLREWRSGITPIEHSRTLFITAMKHHSHLARLSDLLQDARIENMPVLFIDDEADQASLNNNPNGTASTTYDQIDTMRASARNHAYVQYTATPQAPLLISISDTLSPDRVTILKAGAAYTGGTTFFTPPGLGQHVLQIPPAEVVAMQNVALLEIPASLEDALKVFLLGEAIGRKQRDDDNPKRKRSMLVHPSRLKNDHQRFFNWVVKAKTRWEAQLAEGRGSEGWGETTEEFRKAYDDLERTTDCIPPFDEVLDTMRWCIGQVTVVIVNSDNAAEVHWENGYGHILVGGDKLNRGYTVEGLTVTYMPRMIGQGTVDTVQQRARFFGYKQRYLGLCRIFLEGAVYDAYVAYVLHEERMRAHLEKFEERPLASWKRVLYLDPGLRPTRQSVISDPLIGFRVADGGWHKMKSPHVNRGSLAHNRELVEQFVARRTFDIFGRDNRKVKRHTVAVEYVRHLLEELLVDFHAPDVDDAAALCSIACVLADLVDEQPPLDCAVVLMDGLANRDRSASASERINIHAGPGSMAGGGYSGDSRMHDDGRITLQIHRVTVKTAGGADVPDTYALAFWFPSHIAARFVVSEPTNVR